MQKGGVKNFSTVGELGILWRKKEASAPKINAWKF